jgi:hypothetical protein
MGALGTKAERVQAKTTFGRFQATPIRLLLSNIEVQMKCHLFPSGYFKVYASFA